VACHRGRSRKTLPDSWNSFGATEEERITFCPLSDGRTTAWYFPIVIRRQLFYQLSCRRLEGIVKDVQKNPSSADAEPVGETCHSNCCYLFAPLAVTRTDMLPDNPPSGGGLKTEIFTVRSP
jgi:hypothetical protein